MPKTYFKSWNEETEEWEYILDDDVPLASVPATVDSLTPWIMLAGVSVAGLAVAYTTSLKKKEQ